MSSYCSICQRDISRFFKAYPYAVCRECETKAVTKDGHNPDYNALSEVGDNPVFVDGVKCWRIYRFGSFITMKDVYDCTTLEEFKRYNFI